MKLKPYITLWLFLIVCTLSAQREIDSLYQVVQNTKDTSVIVKAMNRAAFLLRTTNPDSTIVLAKRSELLARMANDPVGAADAKMRQANGYTALGDYYLALKIFFEAKVTFDSLGEKPKIASCLNNMGSIYNAIDDYDRALNYYKESAALFSELNDLAREGNLLNNIGHIYKLKGAYDLSIEYLHKSLKRARKVGSQNDEVFPIYNLGSTYRLMNQLDSAKWYLNHATELSRNLDNLYVLSLTLIDLGLVYAKEGSFEKAETSYKEAFDIAEKVRLRQQRKQASLSLSELYERQNMYDKALIYHKLYKSIDDSLFNRDLAKRMAFQEAEYEFNKKQIEEEIRRNQIQLEQDKALVYANWIRNALIAGLIAMILISYLIYRNFTRNKLANKALQKLNYQNETQAEELRQANREITVMNNNLETIVNRRTKELKRRNNQLKEYLSTNSHIVRAPLARILGLVDLYEPKDSENLEFINKSLQDSATELDNALREINQKLSEEENL